MGIKLRFLFGVFVILLSLLSPSLSLTISPSNYYILQDKVSRISLNGIGFTDSLSAKLYFGKNNNVNCTIVFVSETEGYTTDFTSPKFDDVDDNDDYKTEGKLPIYIEVLNNTSIIFSDFNNPIAFLLEDVQDSLNEGCMIGSEVILRQNIKEGQKLVGQTVNINSWAFYQWDIDTQKLYHGSNFKINIKFEGMNRPLGVFVKFSNIYNQLPEYIQPDATSQCPGVECELLTKGVPIFPHDGCEFDARVLPCSVRFKGKIPAGSECRRDEVDTYTITSKETRNGRYVIGIQGQGPITIESSKKRNLGYCSDCNGFENPQQLNFSIEVVSSSTRVTMSIMVLLLSLLFTLKV